MIKIRKATLGDYDNIASLHQELSDLHVAGAPWNFVLTHPSYTQELYTEKLNDADTIVFVAEKGGEIVGYVIFQIKHSEEYPILQRRSWLFIKDIVVEKSEQGKGIGSLLLEKGEKLAKEMKLGSLELHVWSFNEEAIQWYKNKGFETFSIKMQKAL